MPNGLYINPTLFNKYIRNLEKRIGDKIDVVDAEFFAGVEEMATVAKQNAPVDDGVLRGMITAAKDPTKKLSYTLTSGAWYSAYVEFGTGQHAKTYLASIPDNYWKDLARKFYVNGEGWTRPHPFLYPAVTTTLPKIFNRIKAIVNAK